MIQMVKYNTMGLSSDEKEGTYSGGFKAMKSPMATCKTKSVPHRHDRDEIPGMFQAEEKAFGAKSLNR